MEMIHCRGRGAPCDAISLLLVLSVACLGVTVQGQRQVFPGGGQAPLSAAVKADGLIYVSGALSAKGDIKEQTQGVITSLGQSLTKAGSSLQNVVAATVYVKNAADAAAMTEVWRATWPKDAPTRTTVVAELVSPAALVEIAVIAVPTGGERKIIAPAGWSTANPYSHAIQSGDTLFISGQVSRDPKSNTPIEGDVTTQVKTIFANADRDPQDRRLRDVRHRRQPRLPDRRGDLRGNEQGLRAELPDRSAGARDGDRRSARTAVSRRAHDDGGEGTEDRDHHPGRRRHARQAERDAQQRDQGRQPPVSVGPARQQRRQQGQRRSADHGNDGAHRAHAEGGRFQLRRSRRRGRSTSPTSRSSRA